MYNIDAIAALEARLAKPSPKAMPCKPVEAIWHTDTDVKVLIEWATTDSVWFINPVKTSKRYGKWMNMRRPAPGVHTPISFVNPKQHIEFIANDGKTLSEAEDEESPVGLAILRYNADLQKLVGAKTRPEPWMHIGFISTDMSDKAYWAIWVWDTRQVLEEGQCSHDNRKRAASLTAYAQDNRIRLLGNTKFAKLFSIIISRKNSYK